MLHSVAQNTWPNRANGTKLQYQTGNQIAQAHKAILNWTVLSSRAALGRNFPSSVLYQQTHKHTEIQANNGSLGTVQRPKTLTPIHIQDKGTYKQQYYISENRQGDGPAPGSLPGTNAIQLNGSPHDGRRRRSDGLFPRPGSHSCVRRTTRTPADALSTRLDDDDHVDSTQAVGPGSSRR